MHPEDIPRSIICGAYSAQNDIPLIHLIRPIDHVVLTIYCQVKALKTHIRDLSLPVANKEEALTMDEVNFAIERLETNSGNLTNSTERDLVHEELKNLSVLVRLPLPQAGFGLQRECLTTGSAPEPRRPGLGFPEVMIFIAVTNSDVMVRTVFDRANRLTWWLKIGR